MWESGSSGSECLEIVFDKDTTKIAGFASKSKSMVEMKKTPTTPARSRINYEQLKMKNSLTISNKQTPNFSEYVQYSSVYKTQENNIDFLNSKGFKEPNTEDSPWLKRKACLNKTPTIPTQRKFFKTPLKERDIAIKKQQAHKSWF